MDLSYATLRNAECSLTKPRVYHCSSQRYWSRVAARDYPPQMFTRGIIPMDERSHLSCRAEQSREGGRVLRTRNNSKKDIVSEGETGEETPPLTFSLWTASISRSPSHATSNHVVCCQMPRSAAIPSHPITDHKSFNRSLAPKVVVGI